MKKFDKAIKSKLEEREFPFMEAHLADFEKMLDEKKGKKRFPIWWMFGVFVALLLMGGFIFLTEEVSESQNMIQPKANNITNEQSLIYTENSEVENVENEDQSSLGNLTNKEIKNLHGKTKEIELNDSENKGHQNFEKREGTSVEKSYIEDNKNSEKSIFTKIADSDFEGINSEEKLIYLNDDKRINFNSISISNSPISKISPRPAQLSFHYSGKPAPILSSGKPAPILSSGKPAPILSSGKPAPILSSGKQSFQISPILPVSPISKKTHIGVYGLANLSTKTIGVFLQRSLSTNFYYQAELGFSNQTKNIDFNKYSVASIPGFGQRSSTNSLKVNQIFQYTLGGDLLYRLNRNSFQMGLNGNYTYGAKGNISLVEINDFEPNRNSKQDNVWVSTDGLNRLALQASVGYYYQLTNHIQIGTEVDFPLLGVTSNVSNELSNNYLINSTNQNISFQLGVRYYLIRF